MQRGGLITCIKVANGNTQSTRLLLIPTSTFLRDYMYVVGKVGTTAVAVSNKRTSPPINSCSLVFNTHHIILDLCPVLPFAPTTGEEPCFFCIF